MMTMMAMLLKCENTIIAPIIITTSVTEND